MNREDAAETITDLIADDLWSIEEDEEEALKMGAEALRTLDQLEQWTEAWELYLGTKGDHAAGIDFRMFRSALNGKRSMPPGNSREDIKIT